MASDVTSTVMYASGTIRDVAMVLVLMPVLEQLGEKVGPSRWYELDESVGVSESVARSQYDKSRDDTSEGVDR
jgi:hypothetical protein